MDSESPLTLERLDQLLAPHCLEVMGGFAVEGEDETLPTGTRALVMIGPRQPGFWPTFKTSAEWQDSQPNPMDRWSRRVIGRLACDLGGKAYFPFGGPPYHPFYQWALRSGRCWDSPVHLLVHESQGLWVSYRGALALKVPLEFPQAAKPCDSCIEKPCLSACPAGALTGAGYDVPRCHAWLDEAGQACLSGGCLVRRACPVSRGHARMAEQSAYHMGQFHQ
ncbi:ferredoxin [Xinfangfangia sp. CPCC 101601]|uniref:Ferredoxin n=1 Tax=Pseudogemmobacter lacusdianii TaxID=3069608 RepID=A0ABU0W0J8_9RHOB|nr:ferredoxin [Xinfangfangia sp. CPCC 101601]MDQ2067484.1 ferredoxin [Xinfangfangia sp. CPCC 101601]